MGKVDRIISKVERLMAEDRLSEAEEYLDEVFPTLSVKELAQFGSYARSKVRQHEASNRTAKAQGGLQGDLARLVRQQEESKSMDTD